MMDYKEYEKICELTGERLPDYLNKAPPFNKTLILKGFEAENLIKELTQLINKSKPKLIIRRLDVYLNIILANLVHVNFIKRFFVNYSARYNEYIVPEKYDPLQIGYRPFTKTIDALLELQLIKRKVGYNIEPKKRSRIIATKKLNLLIDKHHVNSSHLYQLPIDEIQLKDKDKKFIDFRDTPTIKKNRTIIQKYNKLLGKTKVTLKKTKEVKDYFKTKEYPLDTSNQSYHRIFSNGSWKEGGRFYGPWWQYIVNDEEKIELRQYLLINNKPTVELDYSSVHLHLLYNKENKVCDNKNDAYTLTGLEHKRAFVKKAILIAINLKSDRYFSQTVANALKDHPQFEKGFSYKNMLKLFKEHHPDIAHYLFTGIGIKLQNTDSKISEYIIKRMTNRSIPVLNIHDSFIVERKQQQQLKQVMTNGFKYFKLKSIPTITIK